tara:strand:+ start:391 stop:1641 length:1251 start_codon:yes stop_codon:yes gene_type:complete
MNKEKTFYSFFIFFSLFVLSYGFNAIIQIILSRNLNPSMYGEISAIFSLLFLISFISSGFGLNTYLQNILSKTDFDSVIISKSLIYITFSLFIGFNLLLVFIFFFNQTIFKFELLLVFFFYLLGFSFFELLITILQVKNKFVTFSIFNLILITSRLVGLVLIYVLNVSFSITNILIIYGFTGLLFFVFSIYKIYILNNKKFTISYKNSELSIFLIFKNSYYYGVSTLCYLIILSGSILLFKYFFGNETTGYFQAAYNIFLIITLPFSVIIQKYFLPQIHKWFYQNRSMLNYFLYYGNLSCIISSITFVFITYNYSSNIIYYIYGENYESSLIFLNFLLILFPLRILTILNGSILNTGENYKNKTFYYIETLVIFILSFTVLSYYYNINGALLSLIVTELYLLTRYFFHLKKMFFTK